METHENTQAESASRPNAVKKLWRRFNRWRKRYFSIRLLFLLLFGAYVVREVFFPVLPDLVRFAIRAMELASEPSLVNVSARYRRVCTTNHLRLSLRRLVDTNGDGFLDDSEVNRLREFGLEPEQLEKRSIDLSLPRLLEASHRAGILPRSYTSSTARHDAWFAAEGEVEEMKKPVRAEIEGMLKWWEVPDYSRWETWKRGGLRFLEWIQWPVQMLGRPRTVLLWLFCCFFVALMLTAYVRRGRVAIGLVSGAALAIPLAFSTLYYTFSRPLYRQLFGFRFSDVFSHLSPGIGFLCLSLAVAGYAGRIAAGGGRKRFYFSGAALGLGIVLLAWALPRWLSGEAFQPDGEESDWFLWALGAGDRLLLRAIPGWVKDAAVPLGGVSLVTGALGFAGFPRFGHGGKRAVAIEQSRERERSRGSGNA